MALVQPLFIDRFCRLCAKEHDVTITLSSPEAETLFLRDKLSKYLLVQIQENEDKLPSNVCINCVNSVQTLCSFVEKVREAQEVLKNYSRNSEQNSLLRAPLSQKPKDIILKKTFDPSEILSDIDSVTLKLIKLEEPTSNKTLSYDDNCGDIRVTYKCPLCFRCFATEPSLKKHSFAHLRNKPNQENKCNTCSGTYETRSELIRHLKKHGDQEVCQMCNRRFIQGNFYIEHLNEHLPQTIIYACDLCGESYGNMSSLKTHSILHNTKTLESRNCEKNIARSERSKECQNQHLHSNPKSYQCAFCEESFTSSETYFQHRIRVHPGILTLEEFKPKAYKNSEGIPKPYDHLVNMNGVMKYQCKICLHSFVYESSFMSHSYQHTRIKPFHCKLCCEKFVIFKSLQTHYLKEHKTVYKKG